MPLLQIVPSKTDTERLLLVSPELADVLSAIVMRLRAPDGSVPLVVAYDVREKIWHPPMPLLFQRGIGNERRAFTPSAIRKFAHQRALNGGPSVVRDRTDRGGDCLYLRAVIENLTPARRAAAITSIPWNGCWPGPYSSRTT